MRFSPGWNHQPGLESSAQQIVQQTFPAGVFSPGLWFKPGLKVAFQSRLEPLTGTKGLAGLLSQVLAPTGIIQQRRFNKVKLEIIRTSMNLLEGRGGARAGAAPAEHLFSDV